MHLIKWVALVPRDTPVYKVDGKAEETEKASPSLQARLSCLFLWDLGKAVSRSLVSLLPVCPTQVGLPFLWL